MVALQHSAKVWVLRDLLGWDINSLTPWSHDVIQCFSKSLNVEETKSLNVEETDTLTNTNYTTSGASPSMGCASGVKLSAPFTICLISASCRAGTLCIISFISTSVQ